MWFHLHQGSIVACPELAGVPGRGQAFPGVGDAEGKARRVLLTCAEGTDPQWKILGGYESKASGVVYIVVAMIDGVAKVYLRKKTHVY